MTARAPGGLSLAETIVSLGLFLVVMLASLGALNSTLKLHFTASTRVAAERNLLQASSLLKSEAQCATFIYSESNDTGLQLVLTNNSLTRENPLVVVKYLWSRTAKTLTRTKTLTTGSSGPYLVGSGITDMTYTDLQGGARVHFQVGESNWTTGTDLYLLPRCMTSQPVQGGYYSAQFWICFWQGWAAGLAVKVPK